MNAPAGRDWRDMSPEEFDDTVVPPVDAGLFELTPELVPLEDDLFSTLDD